MAKSTSLVYDSDHMNGIAGKYAQCVIEIDAMITKLTSAKDVVSNNYDGRGKEISLDLFDKIIEHLHYLKLCLENTEEYVRYSLQSMQEKDSSILSLVRKAAEKIIEVSSNVPAET